MHNELVVEWVEALRSGDYEQTKSVLCKTDGLGHKSYCCLGVAAEAVLGVDFKDDFYEEVEDPYYIADEDTLLYSREANKLNLNEELTVKEYKHVCRLLNDPNRSISSASTTRQGALVDLNDGGVGFEAIANFIVENNWYETK